MRKYFYLFSVVFALSLMVANPAFAVKYGELDGDDHVRRSYGRR